MTSFNDQILTAARQIALETARRETTHLKWATVTNMSPVRIRYDGETESSIVPPQTTTAGLSVGDRVVVVKQHGQAILVGPPDGHRGISDGSNTLQIGDDGAPRLWTDPELVHGREYTNVRPSADGIRLMAITHHGTFGTLAGMLDRDYLGIAAGGVELAVPAGQTEASVTVTFPAGRFAAAPYVALASHSVAATLINYSVTALTATSCNINVHRTSTAQTIVDWVAVQA